MSEGWFTAIKNNRTIGAVICFEQFNDIIRKTKSCTGVLTFRVDQGITDKCKIGSVDQSVSIYQK
jgi:hypothetical protein